MPDLVPVGIKKNKKSFKPNIVNRNRREQPAGEGIERPAKKQTLDKSSNVTEDNNNTAPSSTSPPASGSVSTSTAASPVTVAKPVTVALVPAPAPSSEKVAVPSVATKKRRHLPDEDIFARQTKRQNIEKTPINSTGNASILPPAPPSKTAAEAPKPAAISPKPLAVQLKSVSGPSKPRVVSSKTVASSSKSVQVSYQPVIAGSINAVEATTLPPIEKKQTMADLLAYTMAASKAATASSSPALSESSNSAVSPNLSPPTENSRQTIAHIYTAQLKAKLLANVKRRQKNKGKIADQLYSKNKKKAASLSVRWTKEETDQLYECISKYGTRFNIFASVIKTKSETQIKNKYNREDKKNPSKIFQILKSAKSMEVDPVQFNKDTGMDFNEYFFGPEKKQDDEEDTNITDKSKKDKKKGKDRNKKDARSLSA